MARGSHRWSVVVEEKVGDVRGGFKGRDGGKNVNLVKVDEKKVDKRRVLYGYLGTAFDLDKVDFDTRKKAFIESRREYKPPM